MMESFLIDLFVRSLVVLAGVGAMVFAVRRASAAARSLVWRVGIGLLLALPAMVALLPKWTLAWLPAASEPGVAPGFASAPVPAADPLSWIVAIYAVGVVVGLVRLAASFGAASLITQRGVVVERNPRYRIVLSREAPMPFAFGLRRPSVVLPAAVLDWEAAVRDDVVAHEAAHVVRQDWLWLLLGRIAAVLYWPNLGVTWMLHRARIDAEMAADDQVVAGGQDQVLYAEHLVRVARACQSTALLAPMAAEPPLTTRLRSLLSGDVRRNAPGRPASHAAFIMGMLLIGPFAAMGFGPQMRAEVEAPPALVEEVAQTAVAVDPFAIREGEWTEVAPQAVIRIRPETAVSVERTVQVEQRISTHRVRRGQTVVAAPRTDPVPPQGGGAPVPPRPPASEGAQIVLGDPVAPVEAVDSQPAVVAGEDGVARPVQRAGGRHEQTRLTPLPEQQFLPSLD